MGYRNFNREFEIDEEKAAEFLQNAVEKITTEEDIDTLLDLVKIFKRYVPLSRRKYVIAYMLKESLKHFHSFGRGSRNARGSLERNNRDYKNDYKANYKNEYKADYTASADTTSEGEERPRHPRVEIDPDKATSIFISIGKNRRVYPRDLVGLLVAVGGIDRERIGDIKVLANYSFVQLYTEDCQTAIDKLNGYDYRGRKLAVSFSRQKSDADSTDSEVEAETSDEDYSQDAPEAQVEQPAAEAAPEMSAEDAAAYAAAEKAAADKEPFGNI